MKSTKSVNVNLTNAQSFGWVQAWLRWGCLGVTLNSGYSAQCLFWAPGGAHESNIMLNIIKCQISCEMSKNSFFILWHFSLPYWSTASKCYIQRSASNVLSLVVKISSYIKSISYTNHQLPSMKNQFYNIYFLSSWANLKNIRQSMLL